MSDIDIGLERLKRRIDGYSKIKEMENYDLEILSKSNLISQQRFALAGERQKKDFYIEVQTGVYNLQKIDQNILLNEQKVENLGGLNPSKDVWENLPPQLELKKILNDKRGGIKECEDKSEFIDKQIDLAQDEIKRLQMKIKEAEDMISLKKGEKKEIEAEKSEIEKSLMKRSSDLSGKYDDDQKKVLLLLREQSEARNKRCKILANFAQAHKCFPSFKDSCDMKEYLDKNKSIISVVSTAEEALNHLVTEKKILEKNQSRRFEHLDDEQKKMLRLFGQSYDNISTPRPASDHESEDEGLQNGPHLNEEGTFSPPGESEESLNFDEDSTLGQGPIEACGPVAEESALGQGPIEACGPVAEESTLGQGPIEACVPVAKASSLGMGPIGPCGLEDEMSTSILGQSAAEASILVDKESTLGQGPIEACGPVAEESILGQGPIEACGPMAKASSLGLGPTGPCGSVDEVATLGQVAIRRCGQENEVATLGKGAIGPCGQEDKVNTLGQGALGPCGQENEVNTSGQGALKLCGPVDEVGNLAPTLKKQDEDPISKKSGNKNPSFIEKSLPLAKGCPEKDFLAPLTPQTPPGMSSTECEAAVRTITLDIGKTQEFMQVCLNESFDSVDEGDNYLTTDLNTPQPAYKGDTDDRDILNVLLENDGKTLPEQQRTAPGLQDFYNAECGRQGGVLVDDTQIPIPTLDYMSISPKESEVISNNDREDIQV